MELYRLGLYEKSMPGNLTVVEKLTETAGAGFDYLELSIDETDEKLARLGWSSTQIRELTEAAAATGVPIHSICLSGHRKYPLGHTDKAVRKQGMEMMERALILAGRLGIRIIQLAGYDVYYEPSSDDTRRYFEESLDAAALLAARYGVTLAFETMETPFMNTVTKAMQQVQRVNSPWLQLYPDIGNLTNAAIAGGGDAVADLEQGRGHIAAAHLKETMPGLFREIPYGTGHVDFVATVRKLLELEVRAFVGEFWYTGNQSWQQDLKDSNLFLRDKLHRAQQR